MNLLWVVWCVLSLAQAEAPAPGAEAPAAASAPVEAAATGAASEAPSTPDPASAAPAVAQPPAAETAAPAAGESSGEAPSAEAAPAPAPGDATSNDDAGNAAAASTSDAAASTSDASGAVSAPPEASTLDGLLLLLKIAAILGLPFLVGQLVCNGLRVREYGFRMGLVLFTLTIGAAPFFSVLMGGRSWSEAIRLGIDLAGGTNMVFEVDGEAAKAANKEVSAEVMDRMVASVGKRINPGGTEETTVRRVGADRIEVIVPKATRERVEAIKRQIVDLGSLEFNILANIHDHADIIRMAEPTRNNPAVVDLFRGTQLVAKWRPVARIPGTEEFKEVGADVQHAQPRTVTRNGQQVIEFLMVVEPNPKRRVTGDYLTRAYQTMGDRGPCVGFRFDQYGGYLFRDLTSRYQPKQGSLPSRLAILLNEEIHSAPAINSVIGQDGIIEGRFSEQELSELINVLNAGALDVPLKRQPVNEFTVSPLLGLDVQTKGFRAMLLSVVSVFVVMMIYYLKPGLIASLCMLANVVLLMGVMSLIDATFTLPGLAGIVLTIGMSVDANVLIYERFREERAKGSSLRLTIHNGFHKALATIVDSNLTTLITAVVLYVVGTEQIRGFAVSLFIGIVVSMFTALYMGRLLFDLCERKKWLTDLKMMQAIGLTNIDFIGKNKLFAAVSLTLILVGLGLVGYRGSDNLDIDFRGGSMATFRFVGETPTVDVMQPALDGAFNESVAIERLQTTDVPPRTLVRVRSTKSQEADVSRLVGEAFKDSGHELVRQTVTVGAAAPIPAEPPEDDPAAAEYSGGVQVPVTLAEAVAPTSLQEGLTLALRAIQGADGAPKYADAASLLRVVAKSGADRDTEFTVQVRPAVAPEDVTQVLAAYQQDVASRPVFEELNTFDQAVAGETQWLAITAVVISLLATIAYLWFRFQAVDFGVAAVVAVVHDILAVLGVCTLASLASGLSIGQMLLLTDFKMNLSMVAAYLTIVGYSLNDTIVVFDRIREIRGKNPTISPQLINLALNQTLSRTLLTGVTTLIVIAIMYLIGGDGLHGFSFCLFMGIIIGTYSSIYVASPVLLWMMNRKQKRPTVRAAAA